MKSAASFLVVLFVSFNAFSSAPWIDDFPKAKDLASRQNKAILLNFTGSDWCGWCVRLKKEVFDKPEFASYAAQNLILVELDFPQRKAMQKKTVAQNQQLMKQYNVKGYPTIVLLDSQAKQIGTTGYVPGGPPAFIASFPEQLRSKFQPSPAKTAAANSIKPSAPVQKPAPSAGTPKPPEPEPAKVAYRYDTLSLKGVMGYPDRPLALINNSTFSPGEKGKVLLGDEKVQIWCKEIRSNSVVIAVNGDKEQILQLQNPQK